MLDLTNCRGREFYHFRRNFLTRISWCGPLPSYAGLCSSKEPFSKMEMLIADLLDAASESWRYARQITLYHLALKLWDKYFFEAH